MNGMLIFRRTLIALFICLVLCVSVVYAATSGELGVTGVAFVREYDENSQFMFFPVPDVNGYYFTSTSFPSGLNIGDQDWEGQIFHLTIFKTNQANSGAVTLTMNFNFYNMTVHNWPAGTVTIDHTWSNSSKDNEKMFPSNKLPTFSAPAINGLTQGSITMTFNGKIVETVTDAIMFHATYTFPLLGGGTGTGSITS